MAEHEFHRLTPLMAGYTHVTDQEDPAGKYLCGTCMMRIGPGPFGECTAVKADPGEVDGDYIHYGRGGCNVYGHGPAATRSKINPNRLSKEDSGYVETGPFGCSRCASFLGKNYHGCIRVAGKMQGVDVIEPGECCDGWEHREMVTEAFRDKVREMTHRAGDPPLPKHEGNCPFDGSALRNGICLQCGTRYGTA